MIYYDTSAPIRAWRLKKAPRGVTRGHSVAEFYCVLTGPGLKTMQGGRTVAAVLRPEDAAEAARQTFANLTFREVTGHEALAALSEAAKANEAGKNIHDWMHCEAADLASCNKIATLNVRDFSRMTTLGVVASEAALA
jgi:hypothetical protein